MVWPFHGSSSQTPRSGSVAARSPSVRDAAPRAAPPKLFGVVTLWDGSDSHECALPLWCQQARRLAAKIPPPWRTELVVMAPKTSGECDAHYVWSDVTARANQAYLERVRIEGSWKYLKHCTLLKWAVFSLSHLELLLYADVDVDLDPARPGPARAVEESLFRMYFNAATAAFLQSSAVIVGEPDHASPINTGVFLAKPTRWVHEAGLACMRACSFNETTGFDAAGARHSPCPSPNPNLKPSPSPNPDLNPSRSGSRSPNLNLNPNADLNPSPMQP